MNNIDASDCKSASPHQSRIGEVAAGIIVILIGLVFLADNFGIQFPIFGLHNWWALFILVGAVVPVTRAIERFSSIGRVDAGVARSIVSAVMVMAVAVMFLMDASFVLWWPVFMIIGGLSMLVSGGRRRDRR